MDLNITRGDFTEIDFSARILGGGPYSLAGVSKITFLVKQSLADADAAAAITKTLANGGVAIVDSANGLGKIILEGADSSGFPDTQLPLYYDLQIIDAAGKPRTLASGKIYLTIDVTRATT